VGLGRLEKEWAGKGRGGGGQSSHLTTLGCCISASRDTSRRAWAGMPSPESGILSFFSVTTSPVSRFLACIQLKV